MVRILLVRQSESQLLPGEIMALVKTLGESTLSYTQTNPKDSKEHLDDCQKYKPAFVLLPFPVDQTVPRSAMKEGFRHIIVSAGEVRELRTLKKNTPPEFKVFKK